MREPARFSAPGTVRSPQPAGRDHPAGRTALDSDRAQPQGAAAGAAVQGEPVPSGDLRQPSAAADSADASSAHRTPATRTYDVQGGDRARAGVTHAVLQAHANPSPETEEAPGVLTLITRLPRAERDGGDAGPQSGPGGNVQAPPAAQVAQAETGGRHFTTAPAASAPEQITVRAQLNEIHLREAGEQRLRLEIDPPELGPCELHLRLHDGVLHATVVADRPDTAAALRDAETALRQALAERGLELADYQVGTGAGYLPQDADTGWSASRSDTPMPTGTPVFEPDAATSGVRVIGRVHSGRVDLTA